MRILCTLLAIGTFSVLALTAIRVGAQSFQPTSDTYTWSGELVASDTNSRTITVKSRVVGEQALAALPHFKTGDRIVLTWSGFDTHADAISRAVRFDTVHAWNEPFTFPVEFVSYESPRQYVTFTFQAPTGSIEAVTSLKPGEWVTAISRHRPHTEAEAVTAVNAFSVSPARATTH